MMFFLFPNYENDLTSDNVCCYATIMHQSFAKQEGCVLQIKVARDQENIFHFELCVDKV